MTDESKISVNFTESGKSIYFPIGSARDIETVISLVNSGDLRRTLNGKLIDLTRDELKKYAVSLSSSGIDFPTLSGLFKGERVEVSPPKHFSKLSTSSPQSLDRKAHAGSVSVTDTVTNGAVSHTVSQDGLSVSFSSSNPVLIRYQPILTCRITSLSMTHEEFSISSDWSMDMEEI